MKIDEIKPPDQFDIKHLMSNIPKPVREKIKEEPESPRKKRKNEQKNELSGIPEEIPKKNLLVTLEKSAPKKWDTILSRS